MRQEKVTARCLGFGKYRAERSVRGTAGETDGQSESVCSVWPEHPGQARLHEFPVINNQTLTKHCSSESIFQTKQ